MGKLEDRDETDALRYIKVPGQETHN